MKEEAFTRRFSSGRRDTEASLKLDIKIKSHDASLLHSLRRAIYD